MTFPRPSLSRVPVWIWRALMAHLAPGEEKRFNANPLDGVDYTVDIDYAGDGIREHALDVIVPQQRSESLPVYVYFHGGGWTSGDKAPLTKYCASQALGGMVVVNVNYRKATRFHMADMVRDANTAVDWVNHNITRFGGDPDRIVLGGDSAGGQIAALLAATASRPELAEHYAIEPALSEQTLRGLVQHCSIVDLSVMFERGFVMSLEFIRMLLPVRLGKAALRAAARFLSPIEWLGAAYPPVLVTTSEQDYFYRANLNFIARLRSHAVGVDTVIFDRNHPNARHTWQQDASFAESQTVYERLHAFVGRVAPRAVIAG